MFGPCCVRNSFPRVMRFSRVVFMFRCLASSRIRSESERWINPSFSSRTAAVSFPEQLRPVMPMIILQLVRLRFKDFIVNSKFSECVCEFWNFYPR